MYDMLVPNSFWAAHPAGGPDIKPWAQDLCEWHANDWHDTNVKFTYYILLELSSRGYITAMKVPTIHAGP